jgi:hypothetical protein
MNLIHAGNHYGKLPLSPTQTRDLQLEWAMIEAPTPRPRFLNFPYVDETAVTRAPAQNASAESPRRAA